MWWFWFDAWCNLPLGQGVECSVYMSHFRWWKGIKKSLFLWRERQAHSLEKLCAMNSWRISQIKTLKNNAFVSIEAAIFRLRNITTGPDIEYKRIHELKVCVNFIIINNKYAWWKFETHKQSLCSFSFTLMSASHGLTIKDELWQILIPEERPAIYVFFLTCCDNSLFDRKHLF